MIGRTLSHYRITDKLGQGGMGEVYRAEDTNLSRQVAIKVLPVEFAHDAERLARFEREAKLLASLNHPNIASIYGLEQAGGKPFLVLELVEGQTLTERLKKGRIPLDETLDICRQIAEGLEAAHEKGIIHRDLKPSNVKFTPEGKVKILDFGLARALQDQTETADLSHSPTITDEMTRPGVVLGTATYMSPEQARGKTVDKRADIWAFGCILFECLAGKRAFEGANISEILASILKEEPDWGALPPATPWKLKDLLHRCLQKNPKERLHDMADVRIILDDAMLPDARVPVVAAAPTERRRALPWVLFAVMAVAAAAFALQYMMTPKRLPMPTRRFAVSLPEPVEDWLYPCLAISSDGMRIAYFSGSWYGTSRSSHLYCLRLDQDEFKLMPGAEGGHSPFFSPTGEEIGFFSEGRVKKLPVAGGATVALTGNLGFSTGGGSWETDGYIYLHLRWGAELARVRASGGTPEIILKPDAGNNEHHLLWPQRLPADGLLLFTACRGDISSYNNANVAIAHVGGKPEARYLVGGTCGRYLPTGHLIYAHGGKLMAVGLDPATLRLTTKTETVLDGVEMSSESGISQFAVSGTGDLVYVPGTMVKCRDSLMQIDAASGRQDPIVIPFGENESLYLTGLSLSPDGRRLAVVLVSANNDIYAYDFSSKILSRVSYELGDEYAPMWIPGNSGLFYSTDSASIAQMIKKQLAGDAKSEAVFGSNNPRYPWSFSPDGSTLAFVESHPKTGLDIWTGSINGGRQPLPFRNTTCSESHPVFSPDGRWIAYQSDQSGQMQIYVTRYPEGTDERQISQAGGSEPRWAPTGKKLYYLTGNNMKMVEIALNPTLSVGSTRVLFRLDEGLHIVAFPNSTYAVSPDDQKFYFIKKHRAAPVTQLRVVQNWLEELKRLCPTGK